SETYTWAANGQDYTTAQSGLTITNDGCTADDVLNLTVTPKPADDVTNATICSGETYTWAANGQDYTTAQSGLTITNDGCTADDVLNLTVTPQTVWYLDADGDGYAISTVSDCSSPGIEYTSSVLPVTDCDDTPGTGANIYPGAPEITDDGIDQDCDGFDQTTLDRDKLEFRNISVLPNPFGNTINIDLPSSYNSVEFGIQIFDMNGRLVIDRQYSSSNRRISVNGLDQLDQAPYVVKIINIETGFSMMKQLIKF
ncbi:T9SS type A sorting domain-containing protein, partial [Hyunsoonleella pacifica]|uniref:T9SS type A sorting domain-containing protein n=2 Tax=Hyunsoonleella pacifica TaxID=1080224 RepID=UPI0013EF588D